MPYSAALTKLKTRLRSLLPDAALAVIGALYFEDEPGRRSAAKLLSKDEAAKDCEETCAAPMPDLAKRKAANLAAFKLAGL